MSVEENIQTRTWKSLRSTELRVSSRYLAIACHTRPLLQVINVDNFKKPKMKHRATTIVVLTVMSSTLMSSF